MPENEFEIEQVGEVYASALLNLAQKQNILDDVSADVRGIGQLLQTNAGFAAFIESPTVSADDHAKAIEKIFTGRANPMTVETLKSMARRNRLMFLSGFVAAWETLIKKLEGRVDVEVTAAAELSGDTLNRVKDAIGKATGQKADIQLKQDASIIGGVKVRVGDTLIDASVETQLEKIHEQLKHGGIAAIQKNLNAVVG
jgi:F-type H+-transporting ATPase subunit delta